MTRTGTVPYSPSTAPLSTIEKSTPLNCRSTSTCAGASPTRNVGTSLGPYLRIDGLSELGQAVDLQRGLDAEQIGARRQHERIKVCAVPWRSVERHGFAADDHIAHAEAIEAFTESGEHVGWRPPLARHRRVTGVAPRMPTATASATASYREHALDRAPPGPDVPREAASANRPLRARRDDASVPEVIRTTTARRSRFRRPSKHQFLSEPLAYDALDSTAIAGGWLGPQGG